MWSWKQNRECLWAGQMWIRVHVWNSCSLSTTCTSNSWWIVICISILDITWNESTFQSQINFHLLSASSSTSTSSDASSIVSWLRMVGGSKWAGTLSPHWLICKILSMWALLLTCFEKWYEELNFIILPSLFLQISHVEWLRRASTSESSPKTCASQEYLSNKQNKCTLFVQIRSLVNHYLEYF